MIAVFRHLLLHYFPPLPLFDTAVGGIDRFLASKPLKTSFRNKKMRAEVAAAFEKVKARDPNQTEFLQAVEEVFDSLGPLFEKYPHYVKVSYCKKGGR